MLFLHPQQFQKDPKGEYLLIYDISLNVLLITRDCNIVHSCDVLGSFNTNNFLSEDIELVKLQGLPDDLYIRNLPYYDSCKRISSVFDTFMGEFTEDAYLCCLNVVYYLYSYCFSKESLLEELKKFLSVFRYLAIVPDFAILINLLIDECMKDN